MRIQHNIMAMNAYRNYNTNTSALSKNLEKLSSGYKINRAGDAAAGLAISEKMRAQITGLNAASKNVKDGISLVKTAEGAMQEIQDMLNRMDYLATQSANGTYDNEVDRAALQKEVDQLKSEINRIADSANFNGIKLLDGSLDADGVATTVSGADRIISNVWDGKGDPTNKTGQATFLDGAEPTKNVNTVFEVDFADLTPTAGAGGGAAGGTFTAANTLPDKVTNVNATGITAAGDVKMSYATAATDTGATVTGEDALANLTFTDADAQGAAGNGINIKIVADSTGTEGAAWDQASKTVTVTLDGTNGTGGVYAASDIEALIQALGDKSGNDGIDFTNFTVTGAGTVDATTDGDIGEAALAGGADANDVTVTVTTPDGTATQNIAAADWTGNVAINAGGVTATIDADNTTWDGTEATIGTVAAPAAGGGAAADPVGSFKINGVSFDDIDLAGATTTKDVAAAVMKKLNNDTDATEITDLDLFGDGTLYDVKLNGTKLTFTLKSDPTEDNIKGNFDWDMTATAGNFKGNHTAGTNVVTAGSVESAGVRANTVFKITTDDLKDGTEIELDGKKVTISVGPNSTVKDGEGVVKLTTAEAADLNLALGKISEAFGGETDNFTVSVNNGVNGDTNIGLAIYKKADSKNTYTTKEQLAGVFSMSVASADADKGTALKLQIGDTSDDYNQLNVSIGDMHTSAMGIANLSIAKQDDAANAIQTIRNAINYVSGVRGDLGATQNRLEHTANNLSVMAENIQDAESTIRDTDVAEEMMSYVKNNILVQSAQAMLAQANQVPQGVLQLLG